MADHPTQGPSPHEQAPDFDPNEVLADIAAGIELDPNVTEEFADIYPELAGVDVEALRGERSISQLPAAALEMAEPDDPDQNIRDAEPEQPRPTAKPQVTGRANEDSAIRAARARVLAERRRIELTGGDPDDLGYTLD